MPFLGKRKGQPVRKSLNNQGSREVEESLLRDKGRKKKLRPCNSPNDSR
jgi:hypothetical protein